jgi:hypothetical protein
MYIRPVAMRQARITKPARFGATRIFCFLRHFPL